MTLSEPKGDEMKSVCIVITALILLNVALLSCGIFDDAYQEVDIEYRVTCSGTTDTLLVRITYKDGGGFFTTNTNLSTDTFWSGEFPAQSGFACSLTAISLETEKAGTITVTILIDDEVFRTDSCSDVGCTVQVLGTVP